MAKGTSVYERLAGGTRKQRKDLQRRLYSENPGLELVHPNAAGIDIGNESHFVAVPPSRDAEPVQEFGSWTADLNRMAEWLIACGIDTVAMQSTGVYWFAVYDVLESRGLKVFLVNAAGITAGPLFLRVNRHSQILPDRLSGAAVAIVIKRYAAAAGYDPEEFAGHSLRAGLATAAAIAGKSERAIMNQTGHKSTATLRRYIRDANLFRDNAAEGIGL